MHPELSKLNNYLFAIIVRMVKCPEDAKDLVQDTIVKALNKEHLYDSNKATFRTWLGRMAVNTAKDFLKLKENKVEKVSMAEDTVQVLAENNTLHEVVHNERAYHIAMCMKELKPRDKAILKEFHWERKLHREIAEKHGVQANAVGMMISRAEKKMKQKLQDRGLNRLNF